MSTIRGGESGEVLENGYLYVGREVGGCRIWS